MRKHQKPIVSSPKEPLSGASGKPLSVQSDFSELEKRLAGDEFGKAKKEISGIWVLIFLLGLLILLVVQHWLRQ